MVYLVKGGSWLGSSKIIGSLTSFILALAFANMLPKESYGIYKYVLSIIGILAIIALPGINISLARSIARGFEGSYFKALKIKFKWSLIGLICGLFISGYYFFINNKIVGICLLTGSLAFPLLNGVLIYGPYLQGKKSFRKLSVYNSLYSIFLTFSLIIALLITKKVLFTIIVYFCASVIIQLIIFKQVFRYAALNDKTEEETISFGKHLSLMEVFANIAGQIDKILLWHYLGAAQLAVYSFALAPVDQIRTLFRTINPLALPKFASNEPELLKKSLTKKIIALAILIILIIIFYIILIPFAFNVLFKQYMDSVKYTKLYSLILIFYPFSLFGTALTAQAQKKALYILKISEPIIKITLMAVLIPFFGIFGAVITLVISSGISGLIALCFFKRMPD